MRVLKSADDIFPSDGEYTALGVLAVFLYSVVMGTAIYGLYRFRSMELSIRDISFFVLMFLSGACSIPWALYYIILRDVPPFWAFAVRIVSRLSFFWAFCIVTNRWAQALYLKEGTRVFHHYVLIVFNVILLAVAVVDVIINEANWEDENRRCESADFQFTILTQAIFIFAVLMLWIFLGATLMTRIESWKDVSRQRDDAHLFKKAIKNLAIIMGVTCVCLFIQFVILVLDFIGGSVHLGLSNDVFTRCGVIWNFCIDFIPQVVPSMLFMIYMQRKPSTKSAVLQRYDISSIVSSSDRDSAAADSLLFPRDEMTINSERTGSWRV